MNRHTEAWAKKHLTDGRRIVQSRIVAAHGGGYQTQVTITGDDGTEQSGWRIVDGTKANTETEAAQHQANAFHDTPIPSPTPTPNTSVDPATNPDGTINREMSFIAAQQAQQATQGSNDAD